MTTETALEPMYELETAMPTETALYVLMTEVDGENADISLHHTREDAEAAIHNLAGQELSEYEGDKNPPLVTLVDCINFLIAECRYVDVRLILAFPGEGPGEPIDLDLPILIDLPI
jgi:hypothetical protein